MRVVFILSTNYAGSHLLAQLLGAHPKARTIGELHNFRKYLERPDDQHSVVNDFAMNPWFAGLGMLPIERWHDTIAQRIQVQCPEVDTLIDNSKRPSWASRFVDGAGFEPLFVHLLRDPRALVRRWDMLYDTERKRRRQRVRVIKARPDWLLPALLQDQWEVYCRKWLISNQKISDFLLSRGQQANVITYRDLVLDTEQTLQRLMPRLGMDYDPRQLDYGSVEHRGTLKREYLDLSRRSEIALDLRWQQALPARQQQGIAGHAGIRRYLQRIGVQMLEDGLSLG